MTYLLVRNRVEDFERWRSFVDADRERGLAHGMRLTRMWRRADDPNDVFFLMEVESVERANAFMAAPESAEAGERAGVLDGEVWFLEDAPVS